MPGIKPPTYYTVKKGGVSIKKSVIFHLADTYRESVLQTHKKTRSFNHLC